MHILHDNTLTQDNRDKFVYLAGHYGQIVKFYNVEELCADEIAEMVRLVPAVKTSAFTVGAFFRLLISQLLAPEIDKCIYLDSDTVVNLDIAELWRFDLGEKILGVVTEISNGIDAYKNFKLVSNGLVRAEDYFNSGVLIMNVKLLRNETSNLIRGLEFMAQNPRAFQYMDQALLNYLYSTSTLKLPLKFNRFVWLARQGNETFAAKKIYHYVATTLQLDMNDPFNRLWMSYFIKTPWFDADTIGRIYAGIQQMHVSSKASMINLSAIMSGKARAFITIPQNLEATRQIFSVRPDEEIILFESPDSLPVLFEVMNRRRGKKIFFVMLPNFPFNILTEAGFVQGKDFLNGFDFLSEAHGLPPLDSHPLIKTL